jgi:hypothetical protein
MKKEQQNQIKVLICLSLSVVVSVVLFFSSVQLRFPLPLDSLITITVAYHSGKAYGFTLGLLTGLLIIVLGQLPETYILLPLGLALAGFYFGFIVEKFREVSISAMFFFCGVGLFIWSLYEATIIHLVLDNTLGVLLDETTLMLSLAGFPPVLALFLSIFVKRGIEAGFGFGLGILLTGTKRKSSP